jgi:hypothetical protein
MVQAKGEEEPSQVRTDLMAASHHILATVHSPYRRSGGTGLWLLFPGVFVHFAVQKRTSPGC